MHCAMGMAARAGGPRAAATGRGQVRRACATPDVDAALHSELTKLELELDELEQQAKKVLEGVL